MRPSLHGCRNLRPLDGTEAAADPVEGAAEDLEAEVEDLEAEVEAELVAAGRRACQQAVRR